MITNFFKDKNGKIVIFQKPNVLIYIVLILFFIQLIFSSSIASAANWGYKIAIIVWALDEIFRGVNSFRRLLGLSVFIVLFLKIINLI